MKLKFALYFNWLNSFRFIYFHQGVLSWPEFCFITKCISNWCWQSDTLTVIHFTFSCLQMYRVLLLHYLTHFFIGQILAVGASSMLSRMDMNGKILSQIRCAPESAFSVSLHQSGVCSLNLLVFVIIKILATVASNFKRLIVTCLFIVLVLLSICGKFNVSRNTQLQVYSCFVLHSSHAEIQIFLTVLLLVT